MSFNILFTSAGRRVSLIGHFRKALGQLGLEGAVVAADMSRTAPAVHAVDKACRVPAVDSKEYIPELLDICQRETIALVVPLIDTELPVLSRHKADFREVGATVLVSDPATIDVAADKRKTHEFFIKNAVDTPKLYDTLEGADAADIQYPLIIKPARGSAATGVVKIDDRDALEFYWDNTVDPVLQEYVEGQEFTLDVLVDFKSRVRCVVPRKRLEVRAGEVSKAVTVRDPHILDVSSRVAEALPGALGPITLQGFQTDNAGFRFTEINARFGGGHPLAIRAGANFPLWIIQMVLGLPESIDPNGWQPGLVMLRYDEAVFVTEEAVI